jgi:hypothetical protein
MSTPCSNRNSRISPDGDPTKAAAINDGNNLQFHDTGAPALRNSSAFPACNNYEQFRRFFFERKNDKIRARPQ